VTSADVLPPSEAPPSARREAGVGLLVVLASVLLAAPAGLLWAALTPRATVTVAAGQAVVGDETGSAFIAGDVWFIGVTLVAGLVVGVAALVLARRYGPGVALGLAVGGLLAAEIARRTGHLIGLDAARDLVRSGRNGSTELSPRVRAWQALAVWPVAALAVHLVGQLFRTGGRGRVSSG
jgi:hypothetical protein